MDLDDAHDITAEEYREYDLPTGTYRIDDPMKLWVGSTTHRVLDTRGIVHCIPKDCVIRWKPRDISEPVQF